MLMNRLQAEGKGDYGTNHQGRDDNDRVLVLVYFHTDSPVIIWQLSRCSFFPK